MWKHLWKQRSSSWISLTTQQFLSNMKINFTKRTCSIRKLKGSKKLIWKCFLIIQGH